MLIFMNGKFNLRDFKSLLAGVISSQHLRAGIISPSIADFAALDRFSGFNSLVLSCACPIVQVRIAHNFR